MSSTDPFTTEELAADIGPDPAMARTLAAADHIQDASVEAPGSNGERYALAMAQVQATLALAAEQRTANLIAVGNALSAAAGAGDANARVALERVTPMIAARVGLVP